MKASRRTLPQTRRVEFEGNFYSPIMTDSCNRGLISGFLVIVGSYVIKEVHFLQTNMILRDRTLETPLSCEQGSI